MRSQPPNQRGVRRALWWDDVRAAEPDLDIAPPEPLTGEHQADVCIIGGGYTGLWTALRIKDLQPELDLLLIDANLCGSGASGRNGGFVLSWWPKLATLVKLCGEAEALRLAFAAAEAVDAIGAFCQHHAIDAHYRKSGWLWTATTPFHDGAWDQAINVCEQYGVDAFVRLPPAEITARTGSATHIAGVYEPGAATVQPALLARGLRRVALAQGVRIHERTPMVKLERSARPVVRTPHATIVAGRVLLAMNAWAAAFPELRRAIVPISSDMIATAPIPDRLERIGWTGGEAITDARMMVHYYRTTRDGRIALGQGGGALGYLGRIGATFDGPGRAKHVSESFRRLYPALADAPITHQWSGAVDRSELGTLVCGHLGGHPAISYAAGFSGNGVGPSRVAAAILASLALDLDDEWANTPLAKGPVSKFPPEPVRFFGGLLVRAAISRKERTEEKGRAATPLVRRVAGFAPSGLRKGGAPSIVKPPKQR
ncbi:MAG: FAD-dependent oxidoreductase [Chloroflexia bacterium]|nr:FAD-dependent oxidoreductase [Chloroflexia bacterium]